MRLYSFHFTLYIALAAFAASAAPKFVAHGWDLLDASPEALAERADAFCAAGVDGVAVCLPSTGHWGDIGYCLLREYPDRAELSLVQYDYFSPSPPPADSAPNPAWQAIVSDNAGKRCTFVSRRLQGC